MVRLAAKVLLGKEDLPKSTAAPDSLWNHGDKLVGLGECDFTPRKTGLFYD